MMFKESSRKKINRQVSFLWWPFKFKDKINLQSESQELKSKPPRCRGGVAADQVTVCAAKNGQEWGKGSPVCHNWVIAVVITRDDDLVRIFTGKIATNLKTN